MRERRNLSDARGSCGEEGSPESNQMESSRRRFPSENPSLMSRIRSLISMFIGSLSLQEYRTSIVVMVQTALSSVICYVTIGSTSPMV